MTRIDKLRQLLPGGVCALIADDINRRYFTGMKSSAGTLLVSRDTAVLIIDSRYIEKARLTVTDCDVIKQDNNFYAQIKDILGKNRPERICVESDRLTLASFAKLKDKIDGFEFDPSDTLSGIIKKMRAVKSPEEIDLMTRAQRIAEEAFAESLNFIKEGVSERDIALFLNDYMLRHGAEDISFETIALCGSATSMPHGVPSADRKVSRGDLVLMDFGAVYEGYHSDMTRTIAVGSPDEEKERVYSLVLAAQEAAISAAKAGITGKALDKTARDIIAANGYGDNFGHGLGHSVGLEIHESPAANTRDNTVLEENMIMTVEPGIYKEGKFGVRIEDFVVIKQNGCQNLTAAPKNLIKI